MTNIHFTTAFLVCVPVHAMLPSLVRVALMWANLDQSTSHMAELGDLNDVIILPEGDNAQMESI